MIRAVAVADFNGRNDVRFDSAHDVRLYPILALDHVRLRVAIDDAHVVPLRIIPL